MPLPSGNRIYDEDGVPISSANPFPVQISEDPLTITVEIGSSVEIGTTSSIDLVKATGLQLYELTMNTLSTWIPLTLTSLSKGITIDSRSNTTTSLPPTFDLSMTSTGATFNRVLTKGTYWEDNINLPTNTVLYFRVAEQTNSTIQIASKE